MRNNLSRSKFYTLVIILAIFIEKAVDSKFDKFTKRTENNNILYKDQLLEKLKFAFVLSCHLSRLFNHIP